MKPRIAAEASPDEASAIAAAVADHVGESVEVYLGDDDDPAATQDPPIATLSGTESPPPESADDLGPTEREQRLREEIADIE